MLCCAADFPSELPLSNSLAAAPTRGVCRPDRVATPWHCGVVRRVLRTSADEGALGEETLATGGNATTDDEEFTRGLLPLTSCQEDRLIGLDYTVLCHG